MTTTTQPDFGSSVRSTLSVDGLRSRASRHPMGLFAIAAIFTVVSISMPAARALSVAPGFVTGVETGSPAPTLDTPAPATEVETACSGQAWGKESIKCLVAIAKDGGNEKSARIRTISGV